MSTFPPTTLATERLILRAPTFDDARPIFEGYAADPEVTRYMLWRPHASIADTNDFLSLAITNWAVGEGHRSWSMIDRAEGRLVGMVGVTPSGHAAELGYVLARPYWGRGLVPEAVRAVIAAAFEAPEMHRVWAVCDLENRASARVLDKAGLRFEGVLRSYATLPNIGGPPRDHRCYARVRADG